MCPPDSGPTNEDILEVTKGLANQRMRMEDLGSTGWCPRGDRTSSGRQSDPQWMAVASQSWAPLACRAELALHPALAAVFPSGL